MPQSFQGSKHSLQQRKGHLPHLQEREAHQIDSKAVETPCEDYQS